MARITVEDCLKEIGNENRFSLVHLTVERVKQHRDGQDYLVKSKNKEVVSTLREIAAGMVTNDNINILAAASKPAAPKKTERIEIVSEAEED